ncbi:MULTISPECIES: quaternary amine ABC transporter ATP-binding protein [Agrobacterium]|uniref:quaternary amine ABC transporter ATP-binding protein n=1 Tax=Agrobacterium TaxID=357 RepID=UPI0022B85479|nr:MULTISPECIES: glycine betaine/L-proline ABC transporter ATP-binding protein [Agrobacterium]MCZ7854495.1 glycine betaine/L-proline ABC transporter ATP-binding protein [Agrobacterium salinitolerans]MCZ7887488.1 glycine betaine/L-proline ABC transporter ATP-binding protein [Agrobacterium salinitolerans]MCZ7975286.1 glycine betaine/L-proline ABC transporter ATP-binding protein [Agrobacterium salinitolerans]MDA5630084.1 glycine betaine/L-proline ABC transporter ATP-binding protein [Agrobacterium 
MAKSIEIRNLYKIFGKHPEKYLEAVRRGMDKVELNDKHNHVLGLNNINITMPGGKITVVMGLSGSGKSTLIRHINRLIDPTAGEVLYDGEDICGMSTSALRKFRRHKTAMVFQKFGLLPHRTVLENSVYGLDIQGIPRKESEEKGRYWLNRVGLDGYEDYYPNQLSGGMQQRVGLARALANDADILLMDEAYSALDPLIRVDMQTMLLDLQQELKKTVVFITHDLDEALRLGDHIAILKDGEVVQQGDGQSIILSPADGYVSDFVRDVNRSRVLQATTVMEPLDSKPEGMSVPENATLETIARDMSEANETQAHVVDEDGKPVGSIGLDTLVAAMVTPAQQETVATVEVEVKATDKPEKVPEPVAPVQKETV